MDFGRGRRFVGMAAEPVMNIMQKFMKLSDSPKIEEFLLSERRPYMPAGSSTERNQGRERRTFFRLRAR